jgi:D-alanyl-D-alanine carboxypeptidase (penicillin-binding protein 5/6)
MPRNWRKNAAVKVTYDSPIQAPVAKGTALGRLAVTGGGVPGMEVPLLAGEDVPRLGLPGRAIAVLSHYVTGG